MLFLDWRPGNGLFNLGQFLWLSYKILSRYHKRALSDHMTPEYTDEHRGTTKISSRCTSFKST